jgi:hypothetical protein
MAQGPAFSPVPPSSDRGLLTPVQTLRQKSEPFAFYECFLAGGQAGKARDCYSRHAQVRILPGQPIFEGQARDLGQRLTFLIRNHVPVNVSDTARMSLPG